MSFLHPYRQYLKVALLPILLAFWGCGYTLQGSYSRILDREGIRKVYIAPIVNNTYKSGVENQVYNALLRRLASNRWLELVRSPADADAVLQGVVSRAQYGTAAQTVADALPRPPGAEGDFSRIQVASLYQSTLECNFSLTRRNPPPGKQATVWSASFSRNQAFPGANQLGTLGTTSALINDSEFDRSLLEMAQAMSSDVRESILNRF